MTIRYPNGRIYSENKKRNNSTPPKISLSHTNRGMSLEEKINDSNEYYLTHEIAVIHKKPTPIQIVKVDYPKRSGAVIREGYFVKSSQTDFNGVYKGYYIDFEAKQTNNNTSIPLSNFHEHQIEHMRVCIEQRGICFVIVEFTSSDEVFLLPSDILLEYWDNAMRYDQRKSIPKQVFEKEGFKIEEGFLPRLDYIKVVDKLINKISFI